MNRRVVREVGVWAAVVVGMLAVPAWADYTLVLEADPPEAGLVAAFPNVGLVADGAEVTVTASPLEGYEFTGWEGDIQAAESSFTFLMTADTTLRALFAPASAPRFTLTAYVNPSGAGSIVRDPADFDYESGAEVTLTAYPADGYVFTGWTGDVPTGADAANPVLVVPVREDLDLEATFAAALNMADTSTGTAATGSGACGAVGMIGMGFMLSVMVAMKLGAGRR